MKHLSFVLLFLACTLPAAAQPAINFSRVSNNWPTIELYMQPTCAGQKMYFTDKRFFSVRDNGRDILEFDMWCPDPVVRCAGSVSFAVESSEHMRGAGLDSMRAFCVAFFALMNGQDEATITTMGDIPKLAVPMTLDTAALRRGVDSLRAVGPAALWDGTYAAFLELIQEGVNPGRAVLLISTGRDSGSTQTPAALISLANRNRIRIHTIGVGDSVDEAGLRDVANHTGGRYHRNGGAAWASSLYTEITSIGSDWPHEGVITYQASCMDGERHVVELTLRDTCDGISRESRSWIAPVSLSLPAVTVGIGSETVREGYKQRNVPVHIVGTELGDTLPAFRCSILYMDGLLQLDTVFAPKGALLETVPFTSTRIPGGVELIVKGPVAMKGRALPALLANLQFTVLRSSLRDTLHCPLEFSTWAFDSGCYRTIRTNGEVVILPSGPTSVSAPSSADARMDVYPEPNTGSFTVRLRLDALQAITMRVRNVLGQIVHESTRFATEGEQNFEVQLGDIPKGLYFLDANIGSRRIVKSITVIK